MGPGLFSRSRIVRVKQHDASDCGAACLYSVAAYYGRRCPIARIREYACTDRRGTNVLGMVQAAERLGFVAKGVRGPFQSLARVPKPVIAHVVLHGGAHHFVVVYAVRKRRVLVMDPLDGRVHRLSDRTFRGQWTGVLILLVPGHSFERGRAGAGNLARFWLLLRPHRAVLGQALVGAGLHTLLGLSTAIYVQKIVDHAIPGSNQGLLNLLGLVMIVLLAAQLSIGWVRHRLTLSTGQRIDAALLLGYHEHLLALPQRFFDTRRVGEITSRMGDAIKIRTFINDLALDLVISALVVLFSAALILVYSPRLALVVLSALPLYALVYWISDRLNRRTQRELMERAAEMEGELVDGLQAIATVRAFGLERWAMLRMEGSLVRLLRPIYRSGLNAIGASTAIDGVSRLVTISLLWLGGGLVIRQALTTGELMSVYALAGYLTGPVGALVTANRTIQDALIAADRLFEILDLEREEAGGEPDLPAGSAGDITFERVEFRYGTRAPVFTGLDLVIPGGRVTAIVGESGSGKSTIAALLLATQPLTSGRIRIGAYDLRNFGARSLRRRIAVVPQKVDLLPGTVLENLAVGELEPDLGRVLRICEMLGMTGFIESLPAGLRSQLGPDGAGLSGGERQRIAVARAIYRDPDVLVLDEATSALDAISERFVQRAIGALRDSGKTVILIAHRLSTVRAADKIVVLGQGRVLEEGSHAELIDRNSVYRCLWDEQHPPAAPVGAALHRCGERERDSPRAAGAGEPPGAWLRAIVG